MQGRNAQVSRVFRILTILAGTPQGLTASEIWRRLSDRDVAISKRTVYRDLEALNQAGFPLFPKSEGDDESTTRWVLERNTKLAECLALSSDELFALCLARGVIAGTASGPLHSALDRVFHKIEDRLGSIHRAHLAELAEGLKFDVNPVGVTQIDGETLETVRAACAERQVLSVDYASARSRKTTRRKIGPQYVYFSKGSTYLVGEDLATNETKVFALPRMRNATMEDAPYEGRIVEHEKFFSGSFGVFRGGAPTLVRIRFSSTIASFIGERQWHSTQRTRAAEGGALDLTMTLAESPELTQWILSFGPEAEVLEPGSLRQDVAKAALKMARLYSLSTPEDRAQKMSS